MTTELVGRGRTSDVYAWPGDRVIKLFPAGEPPEAIEAEAYAAALVHDLGAPSVACHGLAESDGRLGIVFDRIRGDNLTTVSERNIAGLPAVCRGLARTHLAVHAVHTRDLADVGEVAVGLLGTAPFDSLTETERERLVAHLRSLPDGDSVLHLDYHPQNVHEHAGGLVVIDWHSACRGDPAADVAMTRLMMTEAELFPGTPPLKLLLYGLARRVMLRLYLREYLAVSGLTTAELDRWQTAARVLRLGLLDVASERERLLGAIRAAVAQDAR